MNKRIRELRRQATLVESYTANDGKLVEGKSVDLEKFAELIVRECAQSLWTEECNVSDLALEEFKKNSKKIKQHFGVEE